MRLRSWILILCSASPLFVFAQTPQPRGLVTRQIDESRLVTLSRGVPPTRQGWVDRGVVRDDFAAGRMLLQLNRPPDREAALQKFLREAHTVGSDGYHKWLTPQQFGKQFGPVDSDIQTATAWLSSHGLRVSRVTLGKQFIEFSGNAGQVREAFHTQIHQYEARGSTAYANAGEIRIPEALAPLVRGLSPLGGSHATPDVRVAGHGVYSRSTRKAKAEWTIPNPFGTANPNAYLVTPEDFATQYDLAPLYKAGVNGAGQTIGIVNESNIDLSLVAAYQSLFGVAGTTPQVVIDGDDPGTLNQVDVEAYLDVEVSGAVAPKATVDLYIASAGDLVDPLELAALRAVEDNQASVLSVSFGQCEFVLQNAGNQFWASLWEQAAAQGQTALVASGDSGSECLLEEINTVSGLASTPWNVAVGGTDFYYSDYASGGASAASLWNSTNDNSLGSLLAPLPEQPWDDPYGLNIIADGYQRGERDAAGGGVSNCSVENSTTGACTSGYAKPAWQTGPGVPADGARDLPDVSLFASNGANLSTYAICAGEGECVASGGEADVLLVGGTSASSPAMAGIMALVDQKYGRQGQANFTLYPLAQQQPTAFHDITVGNNSEVCGGSSNPPICVLQWNGIYGTPQYPAGPGYDQASGLGSVDANVLVNSWNTISFQPTTTNLQLSSASITHGAPITVSASVSPASGSGTPTGAVAVLTNSPVPSSAAQFSIPLSNGSGTTSDVNYLPGGEYQVTGHYGGDGTFAASTSSPVSLTVKPEKSNINFSMISGSSAISSGGSVQYNAPFQLNIQPTGINAAAGTTDGNATGTAAFTIDSNSATVALNGAGIASWIPPALSVGTHTATATYPGDASFQPSSATGVTFNVTPGLAFLNETLFSPLVALPNTGGPSLAPGSALNIGITAEGGWYTLGASPSQVPRGTATPTGTVTVCLVPIINPLYVCLNPIYSQTATLTATSGVNSRTSSAVATFPNLAVGDYFVSISYSGDTYWEASGLNVLQEINVQPLPAIAASTTALAISPTSISGTDLSKVSVTVSGSGDGSTAPTGYVDLYDNGILFTYAYLPTNVVGSSTSVSLELNPLSFWTSGANQITAIYEGDTGNGPSMSNSISVTANQTAGLGDFTLASQIPQITVKAGSSGTFSLNLASLSNFSGSVALTCKPSSAQFSCSINPASVTLNGTVSATVTVNATLPNTAMAAPNGLWPVAGMVALCIIWIGGRARRAFQRSLLFGLALLTVLAASGCGGNGGGSGGSGSNPPPNSTPAGNYSVLVTGTANGTIHNAVVYVVVQ